MATLVYSRLARRQLNQIQRYITDASGHAEIGRDFANALREHCRRISGLPGVSGRERDELGYGLRSIPHGAYLLIFRYSDNRMEIISVRHAARDLALFDETAPD